MSSQEPPFEQPGEQPPPEQQPSEERAINPDPREQPRSDFAAPQAPPPGYPPQRYPPPQQGYPQGYPPQGYPPPPQGYVPQQGYPPQQGYYAGPAVAPRRRSSPWLGCLIAFIIVLFLCSGTAVVGTLLGFGLGIGGAFRNSVTEPSQTFAVSTSPTLILTSNAGSVNVNRGSANSIVVQAKKYASFGGNLNNVQINYSQNGNTVNVTANSSGTFNFFNATSVDFTITVPSATDLQITTNAGSITVNGVTGKMSLMSNAGTIGATQASLTGSSTFRTNAGSINFTGTIGSTGTYDFETNAGSIDMTLPGSASFHVNASTDAGSINTSFPVTVNHSSVGATVNGDVGTSPQATLTLKTNAGSINLNKS
jgi:Putative adhesin